MFPEAGQKLGPYEILGELGGGGMARVFRARDGRLHRDVAIKVVDDRYAMPGIGERFLREARAASGLSHPNICTIFDIGEQDGAPYLVMELLEGETLRERIGAGPMPVDEILRHGAEIADALAAAHARGIIHRDIKPANIFLVKKPNGSTQAKVLDFGLAKIDQQASEEREFGTHLTTVGATVGTVSYMSPEQARGEALDARSDLFSLGIVMYEMATGTLPFKGATSALVFVQLLGLKAPESVRRLNGQIPGGLEEIIFKLLAKSQRARFQSATELCDELNDLAEQRSGWLSRMKVPPVQVDDAISKSARDPQPRPQHPPRMSEAPRVRAVWDAQPPFDPVERALPALPGDPQGSHPVPPPRKRRESSEEKEQKKTEAKKSSSEVKAVSGSRSSLGSGSKPVRTSIATNTRTTYPTVAPYTGQHSAQRPVAEGAAKTPPSPPGEPAKDSEVVPSARALWEAEMRSSWLKNSEKAAAGMQSGQQPVVRSSADGFFHGISWGWVVLIVVLIVLAASFGAWRFGWLRVPAPARSVPPAHTQIRGPTVSSRAS